MAGQEKHKSLPCKDLPIVPDRAFCFAIFRGTLSVASFGVRSILVRKERERL
jgi:hypothetical protein